MDPHRQFNLARMFASIALAAVALAFLRVAIANRAPVPSSRPALPVIVPLTGYTAFAFAALGTLVNGARGAGTGLLIGCILGLPFIVIFLFLDIRFLGGS